MRVLLVAMSVGAVLAAASCTEIPDAGDRSYFDAAPTGGSTSGTGGSNGTGGTGGSGGAGGSGCDLGTCVSGTVGSFGTLSPCCATQGGIGCGLDLSLVGFSGVCEAAHQPGPNTDNCPDLVVGADSYEGCCRIVSTGNSTCGIKMGDLGCVAPEDVSYAPGASCYCGAPVGSDCTDASECCDNSPNEVGVACVGFTGYQNYQCALQCTTNAECGSGCCILLNTGIGACAPNAGQCTSGQRTTDEVCDSDAECQAGLVCVTQFDGGPRLCRPSCTQLGTGGDAGMPISTCTGPGEYCIQDLSTFALACARSDVGLCLNTCTSSPGSGQAWGANNGTCDDGSNGGTPNCAYGTDCNDCGPHIGGNQFCNDDCLSSRNGVCEDGGTGAITVGCYWGADCQDCGPRKYLCTNTCTAANNGTCDYDGGRCALGTDCADCGNWYGARGPDASGRTYCDGTTSQICRGEKAMASAYGGDGTCQCPMCGWDAYDCTVGGPTTNAVHYGLSCNGVAISGCCTNLGDVCNLGNDGWCDCGGWCGWETDCGYSGEDLAPAVLCDGASLPTGCSYPSTGLPVPYPQPLDGNCSCSGSCSWETDCNYLGYVCQDTCGNGSVPTDTGLANNNQCEDGASGSVSTTAGCGYGTDCRDCGPRPGISP